jgi:two-component system, sensor histidine kinase PdtaS
MLAAIRNQFAVRRWGTWAAIALCVVHVSALVLLPADSLWRPRISEMLMGTASLFALAALTWAAIRAEHRPRTEHLAWVLLALGQGCFALSNVLWAAGVHLPHDSPLFSADDGLYLMAYPLFVAALLLLTSPARAVWQRFETLLDVVIVAGLIGFVVWTLPWASASITVTGAPVSARATILAGLDFVLLFALLDMVFVRCRWPVSPARWLLAAGVVARLVAELWWAMCLMNDPTAVGGRLTGMGWLLFYLLLALAGLAQVSASAHPARQDARPPTARPNWMPYFSYIWILLAAEFLLWARGRALAFTPPILLWCLGGVMLIVLLRQVLILRENQQLYAAAQQEIAVRLRAEQRSQAFADLGQSLSSATTAKEAARIIVDVADKLLGWDACHLSLYSPNEDRLHIVLEMDIIDGQRVVSPPTAAMPPSAYVHRILRGQAELLLVPVDGLEPSGLERFGDMARPSVSMIFVPIRNGERPIGVLSVQSYQYNAYDQESLATMLALADHCGGALERIDAQQRMTASLQEKEVLLKEVHHRVKNNLQIISSMLSLQTRSAGDAPPLEVLRDSQSRVKSMAMVHERLYQARDLARIDVAEYARSLGVFLFRTYGVDPAAVVFQAGGDPVLLNIDAAIPCGLIINELVSNALKYAFPTGHGEIWVEISRGAEGQVCLIVADNGIGLPPGFEIAQSTSLGLQLVVGLVQQLDGELFIERQPGVRFTIRFSAA